MPNFCCYSMRIKGNRNSVYEFHKRMTDYNKPKHLWRIFEANIFEKYDNKDGTVTIDVCGDCAWSIETCCRASGYSNGIDLLRENSKELGLKIEIWSDECGCEFQEHYLYDNGRCLIDECVKWIEIYYDEEEYKSFNLFKKHNNIPKHITKNDLEDGFYHSGGFDDYGEFQI